ncbi:MAG: Wzt carbohydrate-binding domain-containing protein [Chitinophagaceae bacterium]
MSAVMSLCNKSIVLDAGKILFSGNVHEGVSRYLNSSKAPLPLKDRIDRKGNGLLQLTSVKICNSEDTSRGIVSGCDLTIELTIHNPTGRSFGNTEIALGVNNAFEDRVTLISNKLSGKRITIEKDATILIHIKKLPLAAGSYSITTFISGDGILCDWIQNAFELEVTADLFFPETGNTLPKEQGFFYLDFNYEVPAV